MRLLKMSDCSGLWKLLLGFTLLCTSQVSQTDSAKILIFSNVASPSHGVWFNELAKILLERKHEIVLVDIFEKGVKHPNFTKLVAHEARFDEIPMTDLESMSKDTDPALGMQQVILLSDMSCTRLKNSAAIKQLMETYSGEKRPFDLIIQDGCDCEFLLGFVEQFGNPPLIIGTAFGAPQNLLYAAGNYFSPAFVPKHMTPFSPPFTFKERLQNYYYVLYQAYLDYTVNIPRQNQLARELFGEGVSPVEDIQKRAKFFFLNSLTVLDGVREDPPNIINIGGFQVPSNRNPVTPEIESFLDGATNGVIYFSFGTNVMSSDMSKEKVQVFLNVFKQLPQRVLWKWNKDPIKNLPSNVMLAKWFQQADVLSHKNVKLFISHGGLLSTQEAIFNGIPLLVIPFLCDQFTNSERLQSAGVAIKMKLEDVTEQSLKSSLLKLLSDPSYTAKMRDWSGAVKDTPLTPRERAIFWAEYAIRHPDTNLLQSPAVHTPVYQILHLDVIGFLAGCLIGVCYLMSLIFRAIKCKLCKCKNAKNKTE